MKTSALLAATAAAALALCCAGLSAKPAPWWRWQGAEGAVACSQTPLGPSWKRVAGPFRDSRCGN